MNSATFGVGSSSAGLLTGSPFGASARGAQETPPDALGTGALGCHGLRMTRLRSIVLKVVLCCLGLACTKREPSEGKEMKEQARPLRVAVASNFASTSETLAQAFERKASVHVELSFGSTGKLYAQIENGAPFDVFLAADQGRPRLLEQHGHAVAGSRRTYAIGRLALYGKALKHPEDGKLDLTPENVTRLAIANPETAPYGAATRRLLVGLDLWALMSPKIVVGENISQTLQFVETGAAELGFVAMSSLVGKSQNEYWLVPQSLHEPIAQDAVALAPKSQHPNAIEFLEFLSSTEAVELIRRAGYDAP